MRYECDQCNYKATQQYNLTTHKQSKHEVLRYECDECDHKATTPSNLVTHKQSIDEGVRYECHECDYKANQQDKLDNLDISQQDNLDIHKIIMHGVR